MLRSNLPAAVRHLRRRRGWRQSDLADRAGVSRQVISRIERGELGGQSLRSVGRIVSALEATASLTVRWQGEELDRLMDAAHAHLVQSAVTLLESLGWVTKVEVSFNHYGDRGRVDVLAFHAPLHIMLVIEVKSAIGDTQETLGRLDVKVRLGPMLAESVGWALPVHVVPALVIGDARTARRLIQRHDVMFGRFDLRGRAALAWLRRPTSPAPAGLLWFATLPDSHGAGVRRGKRVRTVRSDA